MNFGESGRPSQPNHCPHLHVGAPRIFSDLSQICSDAKERLVCGKHREATALIQSLVKLQPWFLILRWKTCHRQNCSLGSCACSEGPALGQNTLMTMMTMMMMMNTELHALYSSSNIVINLNSRRLSWAGYVARTEESRN